VFEAEAREARREYELVAESTAVPQLHLGSNGHGPDLAPEHTEHVSANGTGAAGGNGVPSGALHAVARRVELQERDQ
jgi:hypothetical protein